MLIGASVYAVLGSREWSPRRSRERAALGSLALALVLSLTAPPDLLGQVLGLSVGPLRLVLLATTIVATVGFWRHRRSPYLWAAAVSTLLLVGGHTPEAIVERVGQRTGGLLRLFGMVWPQTQMQWGVLALAGAFVLLAFGLHRSLGDNRRSRGGA
jgi:hypothetical protein